MARLLRLLCAIAMVVIAPLALSACARPLPQPDLWVANEGHGYGTITFRDSSRSYSISCPTLTLSCGLRVKGTDAVQLSVTLDRGSRFLGWGGACSGNRPTCTVMVRGKTAVSARFALVAPVEVGQHVGAQGRIHIVSPTIDAAVDSVSANGADCEGYQPRVVNDCSAREVSGAVRTQFLAVPDRGWSFWHWRGDICRGPRPICSVKVTDGPTSSRSSSGRSAR